MRVYAHTGTGRTQTETVREMQFPFSFKILNNVLKLL